MPAGLTIKDKKVIFFDFNDTLVDKQLSFQHALAEALVEFTARWNMEDFSPGQAAERYTKEWNSQASRGIAYNTRRSHSSASRYETKRIACLRKALAGTPLPVTDAFLRSLLKRTTELLPTCPQLFPDVEETLKALSERYRLAIISNGSRRQLLLMLQHTPIASLFPDESIFVPATRQQKKPNAAIFRTALSALDVSPSESVMVGNSWKNDVYGASKCGMDAIWLLYNHKTGKQRIGKRKVILVSRCRQLLEIFA